MGDIFAAITITPRGACSKVAIGIGEGDSKSVHLKLADEVHLAPRHQVRDSLVPGKQFLRGEYIGQAQKRYGVFHHPEGLKRGGAYALSRRIGGDKLRVLILEPPELCYQGVVLGV